MQEISNLTAEAIACLALAAPYLNDVAKGVGSQLGKEAVARGLSLLSSVRARFRKDGNQEALATLDLFEGNPETFECALATFMGQALSAHPDWAGEIRAQLADPSLQAIIARNGSVVERVRMSGAGTKRIEADDSYVGDIEMRS